MPTNTANNSQTANPIESPRFQPYSTTPKMPENNPAARIATQSLDDLLNFMPLINRIAHIVSVILAAMYGVILIAEFALTKLYHATQSVKLAEC